jgi:drug/metabolite transporter (DMT)-like permease
MRAVHAAAGSRRLLLISCFAILYLVWGSSYLATRIGVQALPPFLFSGIRFAVAGAALTLIALALGRRPSLDARELRHVIVVGFFSILVSNGFNNWAMQWVASNQAALLNVSAAFWIVIFGMYGARGHAPSASQWAGLAVGFAGTALIVWPRGGLQGSYLPQQLGILVGCAGWAAGTVYLRNAGSRLDLLSFTGLQMLFGGAMLLALGLALGQTAEWSWSRPGLWAMAYLTVFSSCIAYSAYAWLAHNTTPSRLGTYGYVNPAIATALGWLFLDEALAPAQMVGMVVVLVAVALVMRRAPGKRKV